MTESDKTIAETVHTSNAAATSLSGDPSVSQMLDDLERIKYRNPSDFAVIQSAIEDTSNFFPPQHQQTFKDQMLGVALKQQEQSGTSALQPRQVSIVPMPGTQSSSLPSPDAAPAPLRSSETAPPDTVVAAHVSDSQSPQPAVTAQPIGVASANLETVNATDVVKDEQVEPGQWSREIEHALASLSAELARPNLDRDERARLEIMRRLLYVATNQRDEAVSPIDQLDEDEREYWKHQMHSLLVSTDADGKHPTTRRAALALRPLRTAADHLANVSTLDVRQLTFCKEVLSYGEYRVFDSYSFRAKEEVVLYVEVDNFAAHPRGDSFETELHSSYEIVDDAGRRVANVVLPVDKQVSNNRRRDYFIAYLLTMPTQIAPGSYRLNLTVEDVIGKKSNHAAVDFRIQ
ncbi:MAG: hypothetical protein O3C40_17315 [Planctomycetota bacterium]|nr:hypothetical protein [Planctomycetota bacterium]